MNVPPGWYPSPNEPGVLRQWDGYRWTPNVRTPVARWPGFPSFVVWVMAIGLFATSLALPVFTFKGSTPLRGLDVLEAGWLGPLAGEFAWFANPIVFVANVFYWIPLRKVAAIAMIPACLLGGTAFWTREWWFNEGSATRIDGRGPGFTCWCISLALLFLASLLGARAKKRTL